MIDDDLNDDIEIKAESSYIDPAVKSKKELIEWILTMLGHPAVTVELNEAQLNICIQNALEKYTKYAYFPDKYLVVDMKHYEPHRGLNLKQFRILSVSEISTPRDRAFAQQGDLFWSPYSWLGQGNGLFPGINNGGSMPSMGSWVTWHAVNEFFELTHRMSGSMPDFRYDKDTGYLQIMPEPQKNAKHDCILLTCRCLPSYEILYGNEYLKKLALAYAKMLLGTIRKKFSSVQLIGGGTLDVSIGDEGKEEYNQIMEQIIREESKGQCCFIV